MWSACEAIELLVFGVVDGKSEVDDLGLLGLLILEEYVVKFEVPVADAALVEIVDCLEDGQQDFGGEAFPEVLQVT